MEITVTYTLTPAQAGTLQALTARANQRHGTALTAEEIFRAIMTAGSGSNITERLRTTGELLDQEGR